MNLSLTKLPWYGQLGAFLTLSIAGAGVFWNWYAVPTQAAIDARAAELSVIQEDIRKGQANARRLPELRAELTQIDEQLDRQRKVLPEEKDVADLLRRIQGMATQSSLAIRGFTPRPVATRQLHAEWPIGLELEGTYHNLGSFLERVSKFERIINVNGIVIKPRPQQNASATVTAECTAMTFVLLDAAAQKPKPGAPGATAAKATN